MTLSNCQNWDGKKWRLIPDMLGVHVSVNIIIELIVIVEYTQWPELTFFLPKIMFPSFSSKRLLNDLFLHSHFLVNRNKKRLVYVWFFNEIVSYFMVLFSKMVSYWLDNFLPKRPLCSILATPAFSKGSRRCRCEMVFSLLFLFAVSTMG